MTVELEQRLQTLARERVNNSQGPLHIENTTEWKAAAHLASDRARIGELEAKLEKPYQVIRDLEATVDAIKGKVLKWQLAYDDLIEKRDDADAKVASLTSENERLREALASAAANSTPKEATP